MASLLRVDRLVRADLVDALALSTEAGWNQTPADWARLLDLAPDGCFAGRVDGQLVATATAASYPPAATWIGMVLVARAFRRRGFGTALLKTAVDCGRSQGSEIVGLDATDLGRPVYLAQGFTDHAPIDRYLGTLAPIDAPPVGPIAERIDRTVPDEALAFDRAACGLDRAALLAHLAGEPDVLAWTAREGGRTVGLAFLRPGREPFHLGPVVADGEAALSALLAAAGRALAGRPVLVDAPRHHLTAGLGARGLCVQRQLVRMTYGQARGILIGARVAAATSFEWG